jgi:hypothetical protein
VALRAAAAAPVMETGIVSEALDRRGVARAAMSHAVGITAFARAWTWVAAAVWAVVSVASVRVARARTRRWRPRRAADRMAP